MRSWCPIRAANEKVSLLLLLCPCCFCCRCRICFSYCPVSFVAPCFAIRGGGDQGDFVEKFSHLKPPLVTRFFLILLSSFFFVFYTLGRPELVFVSLRSYSVSLLMNGRASDFIFKKGGDQREGHLGDHGRG
jgi:hypothetical protein